LDQGSRVNSSLFNAFFVVCCTYRLTGWRLRKGNWRSLAYDEDIGVVDFMLCSVASYSNVRLMVLFQ